MDLLLLSKVGVIRVTKSQEKLGSCYVQMTNKVKTLGLMFAKGESFCKPALTETKQLGFVGRMVTPFAPCFALFKK